MSLGTSRTLVYEGRRVLGIARVADYWELTKPKIATLVLVTVAVAALIGSWGPPDPWLIVNTLAGTALVAASASAFNQLIERHSDALMRRTADRPLPAARLSAGEVVVFGGASVALGVVYLAAAVNWLTAALGLLTWALYVLVYTPLKSRTPSNTAVGAVAGALPVLMGWAAVDGPFTWSVGGIKAATLFTIVFLWQFPHFMAIAWMYRNEYRAAGLKMLSVVDPSGRRAGAQAVLSALLLIPVSLIPSIMRLTGPTYFAAVLLLGVMYLAWSVRFFWRRDESSARGLLRVSLVYLPTVLLLLTLLPLL
jgi:protoheme IX farnesyltransferase